MRYTKIFVIFLLLVIVACSSNKSQGSSFSQNVIQNNQQSSSEQQNSASVQKEPPLKEFSVEAFQFGYTPSEIHVKQGDRVRIILSTRDVSHGFMIQEFGFNIVASPGTPGVGEFIANKVGSFNWYCSVPCGYGHNSMSGTLVVE